MPSSPAYAESLDLPSAPFSVLCIDDNALLVDALERRLELEPGFQAMHRVADFSKSVAVVLQTQPTVVILDIDLPGGVNAFTILADIVQFAPVSRVIVFTGYPTGEGLRRSLAGGAWGFVSKGTSAERLILAIHRVRYGEAVAEIDD